MSFPRAQDSVDVSPIDRWIGSQVRVARLTRRWSAAQLGEALGVSRHMVEKYELAHNRMPASRLWDIAQALELPIQNFFEGYEVGFEATANDVLSLASMTSADGIETQRLLGTMDAPTRRLAMALIRRLARLAELETHAATGEAIEAVEEEQPAPERKRRSART